MTRKRAISDIFQILKEGERELRDFLEQSPDASSMLSLRMDGILSSIQEVEKTFHREGISLLPTSSSTTETSSFLCTYWPSPPNLWILGLTLGLLFFGSTTVLSMVLNISKLLVLRTTRDEIGKLKIDEISELFGQSLLLTLVLVFVLFFIYTSMYWIVWGFLFLFFFGPRKLVRGWLKEPKRQMVQAPERLALDKNDTQAKRSHNSNYGQRDKVIKEYEYPIPKTLDDRPRLKKGLRMD